MGHTDEPTEFQSVIAVPSPVRQETTGSIHVICCYKVLSNGICPTLMPSLILPSLYDITNRYDRRRLIRLISVGQFLRAYTF